MQVQEGAQEDLILKKRLKLEADECTVICIAILETLQCKEMPLADDFEKNFLHGIDRQLDSDLLTLEDVLRVKGQIVKIQGLVSLQLTD